MTLFEAIEVEEKTPVLYAGVHVLKWRPEWGTPDMLFREPQDEFIEMLVSACKQALWYMEESVQRDNWEAPKQQMRDVLIKLTGSAEYLV